MFFRILPSISVVIPTLNEASRIGALLQALEAQTFAGACEIIVSDGGSSDGTRAEVAQFAGVRWLEGERGVSRQRNAGARVARNELLVFLDADDVPPPRFLEEVARSFARLPFAVACPWFFAVDGGWKARLIYCGFNVGFWLGQSWLRMGSGVCLLVPRALFEKVGGFDESLHLGEDVQLIRKLCPRHGLHRHLLVGLGTSGRRFSHEGAGKLMWFYTRITPLLLLGRWQALQKQPYPAAPYEPDGGGQMPGDKGR